MVCRHSTRLNQEMIRRNLPILQRGDHIQMPLENPCCGLCCKHHAIVDEFEIENGRHELSVIEVGRGEEKNLTISASICNTDLEQIELIEYRKRKFNHGETYTRACELQRSRERQLAEKNADSESSCCIKTCIEKKKKKKKERKKIVVGKSITYCIEIANTSQQLALMGIMNCRLIIFIRAQVYSLQNAVGYCLTLSLLYSNVYFSSETFTYMLFLQERNKVTIIFRIGSYASCIVSTVSMPKAI